MNTARRNDDARPPRGDDVSRVRSDVMGVSENHRIMRSEDEDAECHDRGGLNSSSGGGGGGRGKRRGLGRRIRSPTLSDDDDDDGGCSLVATALLSSKGTTNNSLRECQQVPASSLPTRKGGRLGDMQATRDVTELHRLLMIGAASNPPAQENPRIIARAETEDELSYALPVNCTLFPLTIPSSMALA
uniref:Uncharacterized protein n=1 Tax=Octactis speculum TaxID=3111310 RepID=A0A7S2MGD2_9STRA